MLAVGGPGLGATAARNRQRSTCDRMPGQLVRRDPCHSSIRLLTLAYLWAAEAEGRGGRGGELSAAAGGGSGFPFHSEELAGVEGGHESDIVTARDDGRGSDKQ